MSTLPSEVWAEVRVFAPSQEDELLDAMMRFHEANEKDPNASLIFNAVPGATLLVLVYAESVDERPAVFDAFENIDAIAKMLPGNKYTIFQIMSALESSIATEPKKYTSPPSTLEGSHSGWLSDTLFLTSHDMRTMSSLPDLEVYRAANKCRYQQEELIKHIPGLKITFVIQPISSNAIKATNAGIGSPLGVSEQHQQC